MYIPWLFKICVGEARSGVILSRSKHSDFCTLGFLFLFYFLFYLGLWLGFGFLLLQFLQVLDYVGIYEDLAIVGVKVLLLILGGPTTGLVPCRVWHK